MSAPTTLDLSTTLTVAKIAGLNLIPIPAREKAPVIDGWQKKEFVADDFDQSGNVGLRLDALVDCDLDSVPALKLAPYFMPETTMTFGRSSKPKSHFVYKPVYEAGEKPITHYAYTGLDGKKAVLLERRTGSGHQTVIPPSINPSGEAVEFAEGSGLTPTEVPAKVLLDAFATLAVAALIASVWSDGVRHALALAMPAFLLKLGVSVERVRAIMEAVVEEFDSEPADRMKAVEDTLDKFEDNPENVAGAQKLGELLGDKLKAFTKKVTEWLNVKAPKKVAAKLPEPEAPKVYTPEDIEARRVLAAPVLAVSDPLDLIKGAISAKYAGDITPVLITYIAATSRVLARRLGALPAHLGLLATSSAGKSYTTKVALNLLPEESVLVFEAGSPRALIYDSRDLKHKVVVFGEADSLPADEDNTAASAVRNLLQDGEMSYDVVEKGEDGKHVTRRIRRPGPTVLITTSTRTFGSTQLGTRLFELEVPEDADKLRAALLAQARLLNTPPATDESGLIAFQAYLQALAPWDVDVPYATKLADMIGRHARAPRILRDFSRLLAFIQSVAVLRHAHRERDAHGRLIATLADYATVRELVAPMYESAVAGATETVRAVVAVCTAKVTPGHEVVRALGNGASKPTVYRALRTAVEAGWLVNDSPIKGQYSVRRGDPIPDRVGLPEVEALQR